ncbi:putative mannosyl-oligosaccharide glucosidase [Venturia nashicola]|uniref:Putative mannosyl-oligosaccharide glucosidase n=1 Tax=Venturia nashicola TaxID=86259 RepID=A0A4Z1PBJ2_9PEZI|nr:putative mannosyl-oligosaccharide glucosidase [Venturia nashicola]TLD31711.1 putative mannosyl-oligosaccharide glucosidase [Venturia nashicola]
MEISRATGSQPPSKALTKRSAETALMPPPPAPKRIKRAARIVDEENYVSALSHIIKRDYFPGLAEAELQQEYIDALESKDAKWIQEAGHKLEQGMTPGPTRGRRGTSMAPGMTPMRGVGGETPVGQGGATPMNVAASEISPAPDGLVQVDKRDLNLSLAAFQAKYTSDDNEAFYKLLDKENVRKREKYAWLWDGNQMAAPRKILHRIREAKTRAELTGSSVSNDLILAEMAKDKRPAMIDQKPHKPMNTFMFAPDSLEDQQQTIAQAREEASLAPPKTIRHSNTRMPVAEAEPIYAVPPSPSMSAIDAAIAGRPRPSESEPGYSGADTPRVAGYKFVDAEPTTAEMAYAKGEIAPPNPADLLSRLVADNNGPAFRISEKSNREDLHHRLVDKNTKKKRDQANRLDKLYGSETPVSRSSANTSTKRRPDFSPAAQNLLRIMNTPHRKGLEEPASVKESSNQKLEKGRFSSYLGLTPRVKKK